MVLDLLRCAKRGRWVIKIREIGCYASIDWPLCNATANVQNVKKIEFKVKICIHLLHTGIHTHA